ncbi:MAG: HAMP domain-containing histidine kinase [Novosphingobium sp.]|nr:HAMP domain-containing histidine kinase [Novosphingobium sp.]
MHFDDRLATVLRQPATGEVIARIQYRQLLDLLGTLPVDAQGDQVDQAYLRLGDLSGTVAAPVRAAMLGEQGLRLRNPRLVATLAGAEPAIAAATIAAADLNTDQWIDLVPALPAHARAFLRQRRDLAPDVAVLLSRLGVHDRGLPPADSVALSETVAPETAAPEAAPAAPAAVSRPTPANDADPAPTSITALPAPPPGRNDGIGAIVRRIEAFRRTRRAGEFDASGLRHGGDAPRLPLNEPRPAHAAAFDFATDTEGRIVWAEPAMAPMTVGLRLAARDPEAPLQAGPGLVFAMRRRQPITRERVAITGAPAIEGEWRIDATPRFEPLGGRFTGYLGRMRRPAPRPAGEAPSPAHPQSDRMRQILHELRTPVNAIQGFAEVIQQQLFGPTPHEYRALAATIAGDAARMLAGFEELERLARLDSGALAFDPGACDLADVITATVAQLAAFSQPRRSGFVVEMEAPALPVATERGEAERLIWRLLATLAGAAAPGEMIRLRARERDGAVRVSVRLPAALAAREDEALFHTGGGQPQALAAGMFGVGFALRLARAEARAAHGTLDRRGDKLRLTLPTAAMAVAAPAAVCDAADAPRETDGAAAERPAGIDHAAS